MADVRVTVRKGKHILETVERPLHNTVQGPAVRFRRRLWLLVDNTIDLSGLPLNEDCNPPAGPALADNDGPDHLQDGVIRLPADARVLIGAGPGTGKTHVACQRIAALINSGIPANRIWVVSFTRTAIVEFRNRIAAQLQAPADAASVRVATLDSHAWAIQSGFSPAATLTCDYEDNIRAATERVRNDADAAAYFLTLQHVVIDEAQDVLGIRAELVAQIVDKLMPEAGVTAFADEAQSIFEFTGEDSTNTPLVSLLTLLRSRGFLERELTRVHRTDDPRLRQIFTQVRRSVLAKARRPQEHSEAVRKEIFRLAHPGGRPLHDFTLNDVEGGALVLMRRRAEVLERSSRNADMPHRLRMAGLPVRLLPWLTAVFWDFTDGYRFPRVLFEQRWQERVQGALAVRTTTAAEAWSHLTEVAGLNARMIDLRTLRSILGRGIPPMLFCSPEFGDTGPILGTVHASKGREADTVHLFLAPVDPDGENPQEETRVVFVGATRARCRLYVGEGSPPRSTSLRNGRVFRTTSKGRLQVEIGRPSDLNAAGLVGRQAFADTDAALAAQTAWGGNPLRQKMIARQRQELGYEYELTDEGDTRLAVMSPAFKQDVNDIAQQAHKWPPANSFPYLRSLGLRSLVLPAEHSELETLHEPWRTSGFMFAPLLTGFSSGRFGK